MPYIVKRDFPHLTQPQYPAQIDKSGRLFDATKLSCVIASGGSNKIDALSGKIYDVSSNPAVVPTVQGKGTQWVEGTNSYIELNADADNVLDTVSCSMLIATVRTSANTVIGASYGYVDGAANRALLHLPYTDNNLYWDFGNATGGSGRLSMPIASYLAVGTINIWGFSAGSRGREIWRNGVLLASDSAATASRPATTKGFRIGSAEAAEHPPAHNDSLFVLSKEQWSREAFAKLTANPWQIFSPQQRETPVGFASSGGSVTADQIHALEWLANIGNSALAPFGYSGSLAASAQPPIGFLATATADVQTPAEWLAGIVRDTVSGIEYRGALAADSLANIDYAALLRADNAALVEFGLTARADHVSPADWLATVQRDAVAPVEWTGGVLVTADAALPIEWRSTVSADGVMPISILQVLAVDQSMPVEFGAGMVRDQAAVLSWLSVIGADALLPLSTVALVRGDQVIMAEWGGTAIAAPFVSGNINVFHLDARGTVWRLDARGTVLKITKH